MQSLQIQKFKNKSIDCACLCVNHRILNRALFVYIFLLPEIIFFEALLFDVDDFFWLLFDDRAFFDFEEEEVGGFEDCLLFPPPPPLVWFFWEVSPLFPPQQQIDQNDDFDDCLSFAPAFV